jgi:hypothetical protein
LRELTQSAAAFLRTRLEQGAQTKEKLIHPTLVTSPGQNAKRWNSSWLMLIPVIE